MHINFFEDLRGYAASHNIGGQRTSYQASRCDNGVFTDGDAFEHGDSDTQPDSLIDFPSALGSVLSAPV